MKTDFQKIRFYLPDKTNLYKLRYTFFTMDLFFSHDQVRPSQSDLINLLLTGFKEKKSVIAHAPTGLGKTAAALSAALSFTLAHKEQNYIIFFVTPKHTQHRIAVETLQILKKKYNLDLRVTDLIGKRHLCAQPGAQELKGGDFYEFCSSIVEKGNCKYYTNVKNKQKLSVETEALLGDLQKSIMHVEELREQSVNHHLCPYEIACLHAKTSQIIIADYHHILNSGVRDNLFKRLNMQLSQCIIIMDEGHNLLDRCRELLSTQLSTLLIDAAAKEAATFGFQEVYETLTQLKTAVDKFAHSTLSFETNEVLIAKSSFVEMVNNLRDYDELIGDLHVVADDAREIKKKSYCGSLAQFLISWAGPDTPFVRILKKGFTNKGKPHFALHYHFLDPSALLQPLSQQCYSLVVMSGTLSPVNVYKDLFGFDALTSEFPNPFPKTNKLNLIVPDTTTKFTLRDDRMYQRIAQHCADITNAVPGNSLIFLPSYDLRDKVYHFFKTLSVKTNFLESPNLSKIEKTEMIEKYKQYKDAGAVLLGASSGNFGEGLDIRGNIVKCVIVVGLPLARPDLETQSLIKYYDEKFQKGWDYGYTLPALIKGFQNAGRCIRSETDKGIVIYLDERYTWDSYFKCFPKDEHLRITKTPVPRIQEFFNQMTP